jgi:hypothetical protein
MARVLKESLRAPAGSIFVTNASAKPPSVVSKAPAVVGKLVEVVWPVT